MHAHSGTANQRDAGGPDRSSLKEIIGTSTRFAMRLQIRSPHTHLLVSLSVWNLDVRFSRAGRRPSVMMVLALRNPVSLIRSAVALGTRRRCIRPPSRRWNGLLNPAWPHATSRSLCQSVASPARPSPVDGASSCIPRTWAPVGCPHHPSVPRFGRYTRVKARRSA